MEIKNTEPQEKMLGLNFIEAIIEEDLASGKNGDLVYTRF